MKCRSMSSPPRLIPDRENNRVIVTANAAQHTIVADILNSLDVLPATERTMRFVDLEGAGRPQAETVN